MHETHYSNNAVSRSYCHYTDFLVKTAVYKSLCVIEAPYMVDGVKSIAQIVTDRQSVQTT